MNEKETDKNEDRSFNCLKLAMEELSEYYSRKHFQTLHRNIGDAIRESVPNSMLKLMFRDLKTTAML